MIPTRTHRCCLAIFREVLTSQNRRSSSRDGGQSGPRFIFWSQVGAGGGYFRIHLALLSDCRRRIESTLPLRDKYAIPTPGHLSSHGYAVCGYSRAVHQIHVNVGGMKLRGSKPFTSSTNWPRVAALKNGVANTICFSASGASSWRSGDENFRLQARSDSLWVCYKSEAEDMAFRIMRHRTGQQKHMPPLEGKGAILDSYFFCSASCGSM